MHLTTEQRAQINRLNAQKSTGPKSAEGKENSRRNALKHGLRAEALPLPNEDPEAIAARAQEWNDYYQPQSPAAQHLVNTCVRATLLSDRCDQYQHAILSEQVRQAEILWDRARDHEFERLKSSLACDPACFARLLKNRADGLRWMIEEWTRLETILKAERSWALIDTTLAVNFLGLSSDPKSFPHNPTAWLVFFLSIATDPDDQAFQLSFDSECYPEIFASTYSPGHVPSPDEAMTQLVAIIHEQVAMLAARLIYIEQEIDIPARAQAVERALLPQDPNAARLFLRYSTDARTTFHRAYSALMKEMKASGTDHADGLSVAETFVSIILPAEAPLPNEANVPEPEPWPQPSTPPPSSPQPPTSPTNSLPVDDIFAPTHADMTPIYRRRLV